MQNKNKTKLIGVISLLGLGLATPTAFAQPQPPVETDSGVFFVWSPIRLGASSYGRVVFGDETGDLAATSADVTGGIGLGYRYEKISLEAGFGVGGGGDGITGEGHLLGRYWQTPTLYGAAQIESGSASIFSPFANRPEAGDTDLSRTDVLVGAGTTLGPRRRWFVEALVGAGKTTKYYYNDDSGEVDVAVRSLDLRAHVRLGFATSWFAPRR